MECLPWAKHCSRHWGFISEQNSQKYSSFRCLPSRLLYHFLVIILQPRLGYMLELNPNHPQCLPENCNHLFDNIIS